MNESRFTYLLDGFKTGLLNPAEAEELHEMIMGGAYDELLGDDIMRVLQEGELNGLWTSEKEQRLLEGINQKRRERKPIRMYLRYAAAAVILFAIATTYLLVTKKEIPEIVYKGDVAPGKQGSKIKLSDGRVIMIDTIKEGLIAMDGGVRISKENGKIIYEGTTEETLTVYNEVFAERGRQSEAVVLPDGSTAWLNAGSSLRYPLHFAKSERLVTMTGEVYYEVEHNAKQPFRVKARNETIEDIGTSFNVNAYNDEPAMVTTLVEGSIKIQDKILAPGQAYSNGQVTQADVDKAIAWHKGMFSFSHGTIPEIMRQLSRWYAVDVSYEGAVPGETFTGEIGRNLTLTQALDGLKRIGIKYRIEEDKRIVILP